MECTALISRSTEGVKRKRRRRVAADRCPRRSVRFDSAMEAPRRLSPDDVAMHNTPDDCWITLNGLVYDVTQYLPRHPGGAGMFESVAGHDATAAFEAIGHSSRARGLLSSMQIGMLKHVARESGPFLQTVTGEIIRICSQPAQACESCGKALPEGASACTSCGHTSATLPQMPSALEGIVLKSLDIGDQDKGLTVGVASSEDAEEEAKAGAAAAKAAGAAANAAAATAVAAGLEAPTAPTSNGPVSPAPGSRGLWQGACLLCGPSCNLDAHPTDPIEQLRLAQRQGETFCRRDEWQLALISFYECLRLVDKARALPSQAAAVHAGASFAQLKAGGASSALRHAQLAIRLDATSTHAHFCAARAHEALGEVVAAHAEYCAAAELPPALNPPPYERRQLSEMIADGASRLATLADLITRAQGASADGALAAAGTQQADERMNFRVPNACSTEEGFGAAETSLDATEAAISTAAEAAPRKASAVCDGVLVMQRHALRMLRCAHGENEKSGEKEIEDGDEAFPSKRRVVQMLALDAAIYAESRSAVRQRSATNRARSQLCACAGMRLWLLRKAYDLGLDVMSAMIHAGAGEEEGEEREEEPSEEFFASDEVYQPGGVGRQLLQIELEPEAQRLVLSFNSLSSEDLGEPTRRYTFAMGLTSAYLLKAEILDDEGSMRICEFATWNAHERGPLQPSEQVVSPGDLRAITGFFCAEGAKNPLAPRRLPPQWLYRANDAEAPLLSAFG